MKKCILSLSALLLIVLLLGCGQPSTDAYLGTWSRSDTNNGDTFTQIIEIYKGGTGHFTIKHSNGESDNSYTATWEIKDNTLNFKYSHVTIGLELNGSKDSLVSVDGTKKLYTKTK